MYRTSNMRAKLEEISGKLTQLVDELRGMGFDVCVEEKKTVLKIEVKHKDIEIAEIHIKKTAKNLAKAFDVLQSVLLMSESIKRTFTLLEALKLKIDTTIEEKVLKDNCRIITTKTLIFKHEFDVPRFKNFIDPDFASLATKTLRDYAKQRLQDLEELAEVAEINYTYEYSSSYEISLLDYNKLLQVLNELSKIKENYSEYKQAINAVVQLVSQYIKAANKLTTRDNSEYLKLKKQLRELELKALEAGDYVNVSNETLKQFVKSTFQFASEKIKILDKSSKFRAIVFCTLARGYFRLIPAEYYLCGEDDNGEQWIHLVKQNDISELYYLEDVSEYYYYSVKRAEAVLLDIDKEVFNYFIDRQGDVFVFRDEHEREYDEEIETDEFEILPNHVLKLERTATIKVSHKRNKYYIDLPVPAVLEHPSHHHVVLQPARYLFAHVVSSSNYQPVD